MLRPGQDPCPAGVGNLGWRRVAEHPRDGGGWVPGWQSRSGGHGAQPPPQLRLPQNKRSLHGAEDRGGERRKLKADMK